MADKIITCEKCGQKNNVGPHYSEEYGATPGPLPGSWMTAKCGKCKANLKPETDWFGVLLVGGTALGCAGVLLLLLAGFCWKFIQWAFLH